MIPYERYTELLSKTINRTVTSSEQNDVVQFEASQPKVCPKCHAPVMTFLEPYRVAHDVDKCVVKTSGQSK